MQAFWDVLWSDVTALALFVGPMLLLSLPTAAVGAAYGVFGRQFGCGVAVGCAANHGSQLVGWRQFARAVLRGATAGSLAAIVLGMLAEYALRLEGLSEIRKPLREYTLVPLWGAAAALAFGAGFFAARRNVPTLLGSAPAKRRFTLLQLFTAQLAIGLILGWWVFTRRDEIGYRHGKISWESQVAADKALFEPYGWEVSTWDEYDQFQLRTGGDWIHLYPPRPLHVQRQLPVTDETLELVARHPRVTLLVVVSDGVTDEGLKRITANKRLESIRVKSEQITDAGVESLCALPSLHILGVHSDQVTGATFERLAKIKSLQHLSINSSQIMPQDEAAFRAARPDVELRINEAWW